MRESVRKCALEELCKTCEMKVCERCAKVCEGVARPRPTSPDEGPRAFAKEKDFLFFKSEHEIVGTRTSNVLLRTFLYAPVKTCADLERS